MSFESIHIMKTVRAFAIGNTAYVSTYISKLQQAFYLQPFQLSLTREVIKNEKRLLLFSSYFIVIFGVVFIKVFKSCTS